MNKALRKLLLVFLFTQLVHIFHGQEVNYSGSEFSIEQNQKSIEKSDPMIIGPTLYDQMSNLSSSYILSTGYINEDFKKFTGMSADDFEVPTGQDWEIKYVRNTIYIPSDKDSIAYYNVIVFNDDNGKPGDTLHFAQKEVTYKMESVNGSGYIYNLTITLKDAISLASGKYWITTQAITEVTSESAYGQPSYWSANILQESTVAINSQAHVINPGRGFFNMPNWGSMEDYWLSQSGYDKGVHNLNFALYGIAKDFDLAITEIISPSSGELLSNSQQIQVMIQNHGLKAVDIADYNLRYRIDGGDWSELFDGKATINEGDELLYAFNGGIDLSNVGLYNLEVELLYDADENLDNNTINKDIRNYGKLLKAVPNEKVVFTECEGTVTDHGGLESIYTSYSKDTVVIYPGKNGNRVRLEFFDTHMYGAVQFQFFNGDNKNAPLVDKIWVAEVNGYVLEGLNSKGAIMIVPPPMDATPSEYDDNWLASVNCTPITTNEFKVRNITVSKAYSWERETITLSSEIINKGERTGNVEVTFYANDIEIGKASTPDLALGKVGTVSIDWTPETKGTYEIKAVIPADEGLYPEDKAVTIQKEILPMGYLIESFEESRNLPDGWTRKVDGGSSINNIWYNNRPYLDGEHYISFSHDTVIMPKMAVKKTDTLKFIYSTGVLGGYMKIRYATDLNGPWTIVKSVEGGPYYYDIEVPFTNVPEGNYYIALDAGGQTCIADYFHGLNFYFDQKDLEVVSFEGPSTFNAGQEVNYTLKIRNMGMDTILAADYSVKLYKEINGTETELITLPGVEITQGNFKTFNFTHAFTAAEIVNVYAKIDYTQDEDPTNNTSKSIATRIVPDNVNMIWHGDTESELTDRRSFAYIYGNYSESLYLKENLNFKGEIQGISIRYTNSGNGKRLPVRLFMGETDIDELINFQSTKNMNMVYNDSIDVQYSPNEFVEVYIPFKKPFLYSGKKNLVFAFYRYQVQDWQFRVKINPQATSSNYISQISHSFQSYEASTDVSNATLLNSLVPNSLEKLTPNIQFFVNQGCGGPLSGTVTSGTDSLQNVLLSLENYVNTVKTNDTGYYEFPVIPTLDVNVTAELYGYYNQTKLAQFGQVSSTIVDFDLQELPPVQVVGNVVADDSLKALEGVEVLLSGYGLELISVTNSAGNYTFDGVFGDKTYSVKFRHERFETKEVEVSVSFEDFDMGETVLNEIEMPPFNVFASKTEDGNVTLAWEAPYSGTPSEIDPTNAADWDYYWYNEPYENVQLGNLIKVSEPGTVTSIKLWNAAWNQSLTGGPSAQDGELYIRIYNKDQKEIVPATKFIMPGDTSIYYMDIDVPDFSYTDDFYVMVHWDGLAQQTSGVRYHYTDNNVAYIIDGNGNWNQLTDIVGAQYAGVFSIKAVTLKSASKSDKALLSYDVYRTKVENVEDVEQWAKVNSEPIVESQTVNDLNFVEIEAGYYVYAVQALYTKANSPFVYSNDIEKGLYAGLTLNVSANNGQNIDGALVKLDHKNGEAIHSFVAEVVEGMVSFPRVLKGENLISISKGVAYEKFDTTLVLNQDTAVNILLKEVIMPPTMLSVQVDDTVTKTATFTWGIGFEETYKLDDNSAEQQLGIANDGNAEIGNYFEVNENGQIVSLDIMMRNTGNGGKVSVVIYDQNRVQVAETEAMVIEATEPSTFTNIPIDLVDYSGAFYAMIRYTSDEPLDANALAMDTDENPGWAYFNDSENGFVQLASWGYWGNFMIRANVLVNGKKSVIVSNKWNGVIDSENVSPNLITENIGKVVPKAPKSSNVSFNIYFDNMETPIASGITEKRFMFNESEHLTITGENTYKVGVQSVFTTGKSIVKTINFNYNNSTDTTSVNDKFESQINLYPNPAKTVVSLGTTMSGTIEIYNTSGVLVKVINENNFEKIYVGDLNNGTYVLKINAVNGTIYRPLVVNK